MATFDEDLSPTPTRPFESDYAGYDPRLPSRRFDAFGTSDRYTEDLDEAQDSTFSGTNGYGQHSEQSYTPFDEDASHQPSDLHPSYTGSFHAESLAEVSDGGDFTAGEQPNGKFFQEEGDNGLFGFEEEVQPPANNGSVLPPPEAMEPEEGLVLREWKRQNALRLEEKERKEKETQNRIVEEADDFKLDFYNKRNANKEAVAKSNREKEKLFLTNQENFHANAEKNYWKAVAELIPNEVPTLEGKARGKDKDKKRPSVVVNQGPKPGKSTDLSRMRAILLKLKHSPPNHMKPAPPAAAPAPAPVPASNGGAAPQSPAQAIP
eukprot:TRINITY_DN19605_c0_g1_i1.p1 TRINITY_DN19605_c0_g1~~TRINITY_DN19605_c0_g1_i1.p1  ORF type:complete len:333 (+),score=70.61 TRINITY_DN19605_c0_g1_i1:37-999(+)